MHSTPPQEATCRRKPLSARGSDQNPISTRNHRRPTWSAYLSGIGRTALLNAEEEVELAKQIEAGLRRQPPAADP